MSRINQCTFALCLILCAALFVSAQAQTPSVSSVNITAESDKVRINAQGDVGEMRINVRDEQGTVVFESGAISGNTLDWNMKDTQGERVAPGTYLVTVAFYDETGKLRKRAEQVTVAEGEKASTQTDAASSAPNAPQATITGSGTAGKIAKFTGASTIGNSVVTESAGKIGIGTAAPATKLHLFGPESRLRLQSTAANRWTVMEYFANGRTWHTGVGGTTVPNVVKNMYYIYDATAQRFRMVIDTNGNVGIGTLDPPGVKLQVENNAGSAISGISDMNIGVRGHSKGPNGVGVFGSAVAGKAGFFDGRVEITSGLRVVNGGCDGCSPPSDRRLKANLSSVNPRFILDRLASVPIQTWNYKSDPESVRHIGPMAQDFRTAFSFGANDHTLNTVDAQGVTMAAIQGLYQMMQEKDRKIERLQARVTQLERMRPQKRARARRK